MTITDSRLTSPAPRRAMMAVLIAISLGAISCGGGGYASFPSNHTSSASASAPVNGSFSDTIATTSANGGTVALSISSSYIGTVGSNASSFTLPVTIIVDEKTASAGQLLFAVQSGTVTGGGVAGGTGSGGGVAGAGGGLGLIGGGAAVTRTTVSGGGGVTPGGDPTLSLSFYTGDVTITLPSLTNGSHTIAVSFGPLPSFSGSLPAPMTLPITVQGSRNG